MKSFTADAAIGVAIWLTSYGAWLIYPPAGFICCGVWFALIGVAITKPEKPKQ